MVPMRRSFPQRLHLPAAALVASLLLVVALSSPPAGAATLGQAKQRLAAAQAEAQRLASEISSQRARISQLQSQIASQRAEIRLARADVAKVRLAITAIRAKQDATRIRYDAVQSQLQARARAAYIDGPASGLEILLTASSFSDLSNRIEYIDTLARQDEALAAQLQSIQAELQLQEEQQQKLETDQQDALAYQQELQDRMKAARVQALGMIGQLASEKRQADALVAHWGKVVQVLAPPPPPPSGGGSHGSDPFLVCPVGNPHVVANDFGAPRYVGGVHYHAGNDILAPTGTPIYAPFPGTAVNVSGGLGGQAVAVYGSRGFVYNAHLSRFGTLGPVSAGTVIGYVGTSGDAAGGPAHDHFEWHPGVIPRGARVINGAIDPHPFLMGVC